MRSSLSLLSKHSASLPLLSTSFLSLQFVLHEHEFGIQCGMLLAGYLDKLRKHTNFNMHDYKFHIYPQPGYGCKLCIVLKYIIVYLITLFQMECSNAWSQVKRCDHHIAHKDCGWGWKSKWGHWLTLFVSVHLDIILVLWFSHNKCWSSHNLGQDPPTVMSHDTHMTLLTTLS